MRVKICVVRSSALALNLLVFVIFSRCGNKESKCCMQLREKIAIYDRERDAVTGCASSLYNAEDRSFYSECEVKIQNFEKKYNTKVDISVIPGGEVYANEYARKHKLGTSVPDTYIIDTGPDPWGRSYTPATGWSKGNMASFCGGECVD